MIIYFIIKLFISVHFLWLISANADANANAAALLYKDCRFKVKELFTENQFLLCLPVCSDNVFLMSQILGYAQV